MLATTFGLTIPWSLVMAFFWIGDKKPPRIGGASVSAAAFVQIVTSLGKDPASARGGLPASVASGRLRKYDFTVNAVASAAQVLALVRHAPRGAMLRWQR